MEETDLQQYRTSWKSEKSFDQRILSAADIQGFLKKKSKKISRLFRKGLVFDMVLKSVIAASFIVLLVLFFGSVKVVAICSSLLVVSIAAILFQLAMLRKIPQADYAADNLRKVLDSKISFYRKKYLHSLYVGALSNSLLIISGILFYFYFKYGEVRPFEMDDCIVFGAVIIIGFLLGAYMQVRQHHFHIRQLEVCLDEIDENTISDLTLKRQRNRRRQLLLVYLLAIIFGLLVLAFLLTQTL